MSNKLGCNTLYPHGRLNNPREQFNFEAHCQALRDLAEAGFQCAEFSHSEALTPEEMSKMPAEYERAGIEAWSAHSWVPIPASVNDVPEALPKLEECIDNTRRLQAQVMVVHAAGNRLDMSDPTVRHERAEAIKATVEPLAKMAEPNGIVIAIENCGREGDMQFLAELLDRLDLPNLGFNIDTGHAVLHGLDIAETIELMGKRLFTTHLQDNFGERDDHLPPGEGSIGWGPVFRAFRKIGYDRTFMVEISDCPPGREPVAKDDLRKAYENLVRFVQQW